MSHIDLSATPVMPANPAQAAASAAAASFAALVDKMDYLPTPEVELVRQADRAGIVVIGLR